ncbi:MAG: hypothetical protein AB1560_00745 [Pseudomonadota bacterium]
MKMESFFRGNGFTTAVVAENPENIHKNRNTPSSDPTFPKDLVFTNSARNPIKGSAPLPLTDCNSRIEREADRNRTLIDKTVTRLRDLAKQLRDIFIFPDDKNLWIPSVVYAAYKILRKQKCEHLLTSSPPVSCHAAGLILKGLFPSLRWIADFRDPWIYQTGSGSVNLHYSRSSRLSQWASKKMFSKVLSKADIITVTTKPMIKLFETVSGATLGEKCLLLPNGVDRHIFDNIEPVRISENKMVFGHLGDLDYAHRNPEPLLKAFSDLVGNGSLSRDEFEVHFWGRLGSWEGRSLNDMVRDYELDGVVFEHGQVPYRESLAIMKSVDVLLLFAEDQPLQIPAKTYEYLFAGTPVLAFVEEGSATQSLIKSFKQVHTTSRKNEKETKSLLASLFAKRRIEARVDESAHDDKRNISTLIFDYHLEKLQQRMESCSGEEVIATIPEDK